jgi:hypothetical protein
MVLSIGRGAVVLAWLSIAACEQKLPPHIDRIAGYRDTVTSTVSVDESADFSTIRSFTIVEPEQDVGDNQLAGLTGQGVRRVLGEFLRNMGYVPAEPGRTPDMLVAISARTDSSTHVVAGGTAFLPVWEPGPTYNFNATSFGPGGSMRTISGVAQGSGTTSYIPYREPDRVVTKHRARLTIAAYEAKTRRQVALMRASGDTSAGDAVYAAQFLIETATARFPRNPNYAGEVRNALNTHPIVGYLVRPFSFNGGDLDYYVHQVIEGTPAAAAGLQPNDVLVAINGEPLRNTSMSQRWIDKSLPAGQKAEIRVWRDGVGFVTLAVEPRARPPRS